jgi:hypothetical protein
MRWLLAAVGRRETGDEASRSCAFIASSSRLFIASPMTDLLLTHAAVIVAPAASMAPIGRVGLTGGHLAPPGPAETRRPERQDPSSILRVSAYARSVTAKRAVGHPSR